MRVIIILALVYGPAAYSFCSGDAHWAQTIAGAVCLPAILACATRLARLCGVERDGR